MNKSMLPKSENAGGLPGGGMAIAPYDPRNRRSQSNIEFGNPHFEHQGVNMGINNPHLPWDPSYQRT